jgi:hypothetical protein
VHGAVFGSIRMILKEVLGLTKKVKQNHTDTASVVQEFLAAKCIRAISYYCYFPGLALAHFILLLKHKI